jgi:hypothetical protein
VAFPTIPTTGNGRLLSQNQNNATSPRTFPSLTSLTKNAGDLLLAIVVAYERGAAGATFSSWGASFTERADIDGGANLPAFGIASKVSDGTETGTFTVAQAGVVGHCSLFLLSIAGGGPIQIDWTATVATGTAAAADPASLNPANWGTEDTLWIAVAMNGETNTGGSWTGLGTPTAPTNYTSLNSPGIGTDAVGGIHSAIAFRQNNTDAEDVGTWTGQDTSNARNAAIVIAVRPLLVPTGAGIRGNSGDGHVPGTRVRAGRGVLGRIVYAGSGVSAFVGSGIDAVLFVENGSGISPRSGGGVAVKTAGEITKAGAGVREHIGAATDAVLFVDAGTADSARVGSGTDAVLFVEAGAGSSARLAAATDTVEFTETGTGILALVGSGATEVGGGVTYEKTGLGRLGTSAIISAKEGAGVRGHVGSATDAVNFAEAGTGVLQAVGSGVATRAGAKFGTGTSARIGSAADAVLFVDAGQAVLPHVASAADAVIYIENGTGTAGNPPLHVDSGAGITGRVGAGVATKVAGGGAIEKTGAGVRAFIGSATDANTRSRAGSGVQVKVGAATDTSQRAELGSGIRGHVGSGPLTRGAGFEKSGTGTTTRAAGGIDAITYIDTAAGVTGRIGSAFDTATFIDAGVGVRGHVGSGDKFKLGEHIKFGVGVTAHIASGTALVEIQLPPPGSVTAVTSGRFPRGKRGSLTNARRGGVLTG